MTICDQNKSCYLVPIIHGHPVLEGSADLHVITEVDYIVDFLDSAFNSQKLNL